MCILLCTRRSQHLLKITILSPRKALTEFQLGLFRSKENRLYIIGYPLSAPMMRINVSLEGDSLELKSKKKLKFLSRLIEFYAYIIIEWFIGILLLVNLHDRLYLSIYFIFRTIACILIRIASVDRYIWRLIYKRENLNGNNGKEGRERDVKKKLHDFCIDSLRNRLYREIFLRQVNICILFNRLYLTRENLSYRLLKKILFRFCSCEQFSLKIIIFALIDLVFLY